MKVATILSVLYICLSIFGLALLVVSAHADNTIDTVIGMGAVILGVLGLEAQSINESIWKSREVR